MIVRNELEYRDQPGLDQNQILKLSREMGVLQAEEMVCRALEELAARLSELCPQTGTHELDQIIVHAKAVVPLASRIGMSGLTKVSKDVIICAERVDYVALGATLARLQRVGDRSLLEIWDVADLTM